MVGHDGFNSCLYLHISDNYRMFPFQNFELLLLIEQKNGRLEKRCFPPYFAKIRKNESVKIWNRNRQLVKFKLRNRTKEK
jgi:hypothetical protein